MTHKKLYRSETNKIISGVLGGLGEYLDIDPTVVRLAYAFLTIITGGLPGIVLYFVALLIVPQHQHFNIHKVHDVDEAVKKETTSKETDKTNQDLNTENKIVSE